MELVFSGIYLPLSRTRAFHETPSRARDRGPRLYLPPDAEGRRCPGGRGIRGPAALDALYGLGHGSGPRRPGEKARSVSMALRRLLSLPATPSWEERTAA